MDTYSDENSDSKVIQMWSRDDSNLSNDPLEDLLNEFGTEDQNFGWEDELLDELDLDHSDLRLSFQESQDYFYDQLGRTASDQNDLESVTELVHKAKYLSHKLKYYNTYLLNRE